MVRQLLSVLLLAASAGAQALEYRSVSVPVAVFFDAPSAQAKKLYLVRRDTPVEVLVQVEGWIKVRDAEGTIAWLPKGTLDERRNLVVIAPTADVRQAAKPDAPLVFEAEKWVALELLEPGPAGWAKVRHRDGATGYVRVTQVWGL